MAAMATQARLRHLVPATIPLLLALFGAAAWGQQASPPTGLAIANEFIRIRVNPGPDETGRFAVDTTGGDPSRAADDNQVLIYGSREPWTSYTTVFMDEQPYIFGGATARRAGRGVGVGQIVHAPRVVGDAISCTVRIGEVEVTQDLSFARSPTTRVKDAARIAYQVTNRGSSARSVGLRVVLDTMLGSNDGAPLRAGDKAIATATQLTGENLPDYWQAFDSLSKPAVISQGTLRADGLTSPDLLEMVDWGTLADTPWVYDPFPSGSDFVRRGEEEQDTAVALYWRTVVLKPGESRTFATLYGVGGVSLSPAQLSLGLTAPAEVDYQYDDSRPFLVVAYIENSGGFQSRKTACSLALPKGLKLVQGKAKVDLGMLAPGETKQISWRVAADGGAVGPLRMAASVTSENLEPNRVEREIVVNSPPQIVLKVDAPARLGVTPENRYAPNPFEVKTTARNAGAQVARNLVVTISLPEGLKLDSDSSATQVCPRVDAGGSETFTWRTRALGMPTGDLALMVKATAAGAKAVEAKRVVVVPELTPEIRVYPADQVVPATTDGRPTLVPIVVQLAPAREFIGCRLSVRYDAAVLSPLYVSRGEAFVDEGRLLSPWTDGRVAEGIIAGVGGERRDAPELNKPETALFTITFLAKGSGKSPIEVEATSMQTGRGGDARLRLVGGSVTVENREEAK